MTTGRPDVLRCAALGQGGALCGAIEATVVVGGQLSAVFLWALLSWDVWLDGRPLREVRT